MGLGLKMENFHIMQVHWKDGHKKKQPIGGEESPKKGDVDSLEI